jgi:hypothetical protein
MSITPSKAESKQPEPNKPEDEQPDLREDTLLSQEWLEGEPRDRLVDLIFELVLELKARLRGETLVTPAIPADSFIPEQSIDVQEFVRLPAVSAKEPDEVAKTSWRIVLISSNPDHQPLGLEVYDDVTIGRWAEGKKIDLDLTEYDAEQLGVSRWHALLIPDEDRVLLADLGSTNGTFCNATRIGMGAPQEVKDNDTISFGGLHFKVKIVSHPGEPIS